MALVVIGGVAAFGAGEGEYPTPPKGLAQFEIELIQARAQELLEPYEGHSSFPKMRRR